MQTHPQTVVSFSTCSPFSSEIKRVYADDLLFCMSTKSTFLQKFFPTLKRLSVSFHMSFCINDWCVCVFSQFQVYFCASSLDFDLYSCSENIKVLPRSSLLVFTWLMKEKGKTRSLYIYSISMKVELIDHWVTRDHLLDVCMFVFFMRKW